ncbi:indole-3-glycerol phosphate synthase TrpC [soil metagenome]
MNSSTETGTVLDQIVAQTRIDVERRKQQVSRDDLYKQLDRYPDSVDFRSALDRDTVTVIAEIKRASPSRGRFPVEVDPAEVARDYATGGAAAISCLTDEPFFQGSLRDLKKVSAVTESLPDPIPVLRKDFIIDLYQVDEARVNGASCILLIVACLDEMLFRELSFYAWTLGLSVLVEVHDRYELERALALGAKIIGINNRNLKTLDVDLDVTTSLAPFVPPDVVLVGESGISSREHIETMARAGVDAVLVGESLIVREDRAAAVRALLGVCQTRRE